MSRDGDPDGNPDKADFLSRWSARKRANQMADPAPVSEQVSPAEPAPAPELSPEEQDIEDRSLLAALDLKHPADLQPGDDVKGFMQAAVPDRLRRLALRQLWRGNPVLANLDQLVDYGEDFTDSAMVVENMQTLYQVGKGMLRKVEALAEDEEDPAATASDDPLHTTGEDPENAQESAHDDIVTYEPLPDENATMAIFEESPAESTAPRRRMTFRYEN